LNSLDDFGRKIRMLRQQLGLSQAALGQRINISQKEISHYETNYRKPPVELLPNLAESLGTTIEELYGDSLYRDGECEILKKKSIWLVAEKMELLNETERKEVVAFIEKLIESRNKTLPSE
jgi:transcriptional regulator with XRE-family HTH domain